MNLILKSTTSQIVLEDAGVIVDTGAGTDFSQSPGLLRALAKSTMLRDLVTAGTIVVNSGTADMSTIDGLKYLNQLWIQAGFDVAAQFTQIEGTITDYQHGDRGGGSLHPAATPAVAGFMSPTDKTKLDNVGPGSTALGSAIPQPVASVGATGTSLAGAHEDHVHAHGSQLLGLGTDHALATPLVAGFMSPGDKAKVDDLYGIRAEDAEMILMPEGPVQGQGQRVTQTVFEGASFVVRRRVIFNRMRIRFNAVPGNGDFVIAIYQEQDGRSGTAALIASAVFAASAAGAFDIPVSEGTVQLVPGLCYVLFGKRTGSQQLSIYTKPTIALLCDPGFSASNLHPTNFTTNIATGAFPATFNPRPTTGGGNTTASTTDLTPQIRLWKV